MDRGRFTLILVLLAGVVAVVSFAAGLAILDDGSDAPPERTSDTSETTGTTAAGGATTSTTTTTVATTTGALPSPSYVAVVSSEGDEAFATNVAAQVAAAGYPAGVLHSDDYPSLNPGFWVAFAGPYESAEAAAAAVQPLAADGFDGAYVRCAGSRKDCGRDDGEQG